MNIHNNRNSPLWGTHPCSSAEGTTGQTPAPSLVATILNETGGNPFFLTEIAHHLRQLDETAVPTNPTKLLPTVRGAIRQRLNRLSPACNRLLTFAAVIGREFTLTRLARLGDPVALAGTTLTQDRLLTVLDEALQAQLIQPFSASGAVAGRYRFCHECIHLCRFIQLILDSYFHGHSLMPVYT